MADGGGYPRQPTDEIFKSVTDILQSSELASADGVKLEDIIVIALLVAITATKDDGVDLKQKLALCKRVADSLVERKGVNGSMMHNKLGASIDAFADAVKRMRSVGANPNVSVMLGLLTKRLEKVDALKKATERDLANRACNIVKDASTIYDTVTLLFSKQFEEDEVEEMMSTITVAMTSIREESVHLQAGTTLADGDRLRQENASLRQQLADLQARYQQLSVQQQPAGVQHASASAPGFVATQVAQIESQEDVDDDGFEPDDGEEPPSQRFCADPSSMAGHT